MIEIRIHAIVLHELSFQKCGSFGAMYRGIWVAIFNLKCNIQNNNAICKMVLHSVFKFTFYITILATFGAK